MKYSSGESSAGGVEEITELLPAIWRKVIGSRIGTGGAWELTLPQLRALGTVRRNPGCTMGELAGALGGSMSAATALATRLVLHGFVQREDDPHDRRVIRLRLTDAGLHAHESCRKDGIQRMERALQTLSEVERERIREGLRLLHRALEHTETTNHEDTQ